MKYICKNSDQKQKLCTSSKTNIERKNKKSKAWEKHREASETRKMKNGKWRGTKLRGELSPP